MNIFKEVHYTFNSTLENAPYSLDVYFSRNGEVVIDTKQTFPSLEEFFCAVEEVIPILEAEGA